MVIGTVELDVCAKCRSGVGASGAGRPMVITVEARPADGGLGRSLTMMVGTNSGGRRRSTTAMYGWASEAQRCGVLLV